MEHHPHLLRARHNVGVGDNVAVGIDDRTGSETPLASDDQAGVAVVRIFNRTMTRDEHLHDAWGDGGRERLDGGVHIAQHAQRRSGRLRESSDWQRQNQTARTECDTCSLQHVAIVALRLVMVSTRIADLCLPSSRSAGYAHRRWTDDARCAITPSTVRVRRHPATEDRGFQKMDPPCPPFLRGGEASLCVLCAPEAMSVTSIAA